MDVPGPLYSWVHSTCDYVHKTCTDVGTRLRDMPLASGFLQLIAFVEQISIFSEGEPPLLLTCSSQVDGSTLMSIWEVQIELFEM